MNPCHAKSLYPLPCLCFRGLQGVGVPVPVKVKVKVKVKSKVPGGVSTSIRVLVIPAVFPSVRVLS